MLEISKYNDYKKTTEYKPDQEWTQTEKNPTSIAIILVTIDDLKENECIVIRKLPKNKNG